MSGLTPINHWYIDVLTQHTDLSIRLDKKKAPSRCEGAFWKKEDEAMTYSTALAVPSALRSLTAVFGMGTGGASAL